VTGDVRGRTDLDPRGTATIARFLDTRGLQRADVEPLSLQTYLSARSVVHCTSIASCWPPAISPDSTGCRYSMAAPWAPRDFGPFFGFTVAAAAGARMIGRGLVAGALGS
jgi:hypothetical protein